MSQISYGGKTHSYEDVLKGNFTSSPALEFCSEWLQNERQTFTINTSGSTGIPKSIEISREQMKRSAAMTIEALALSKSKNSLVCLNTDFIAGKMMLVRSLEIKIDITIVPTSSNPLKEIDSNASFDFVAFVPLQLETILRESPDKTTILDGMKAIIIGGAALTPFLEEKIQWIKAPVYHTFGMTETISHIALKRLNGLKKSDYFKIVNGVTISQDERGCLVINSPFSKEEITTNDIVEIKDSIYFKWIGRYDNIINSGGIKINPEKIETTIDKVFFNLKLPNRFFITGLPHPQLGQAVSLIIEGNDSDKTLLNKIKNELASSLSKYELPKNIFFLTSFKETPTGKIDRLNTVKYLN